jgi:hypothetical protein
MRMPTTMHSLEGTHQHAKSAKVYTYRAEYETRDDGDIVWRARVSEEDQLRAEPGGTIRTGSPAADAIAEKAVLDALLAAIDEIEDAERL